MPLIQNSLPTLTSDGMCVCECVCVFAISIVEASQDRRKGRSLRPLLLPLFVTIRVLIWVLNSKRISLCYLNMFQHL